MDEIAVARKLAATRWHYPEVDPDALARLQQRIAGAGRRQDLITYSDLVRGVTFYLPNVNDGKPFEIDVSEWRDLDRAIIGEFLGYISMLSFREAGFMASALAVEKAEMKPSVHFFRWMRELGALPDTKEETVLAFWLDQVKKAHAWFKAHSKT
ncbi:MAG: hypothetical protein GX616_06800 [Planctomycetes bacterium]|nr:hypothetical protein [Planctomycetota bacterium]